MNLSFAIKHKKLMVIVGLNFDLDLWFELAELMLENEFRDMLSTENWWLEN